MIDLNAEAIEAVMSTDWSPRMPPTPEPKPRSDADVEMSPEGVSADLGPFEPPADYAFEPEFDEQRPRPIPDQVRLGRFYRGRRAAVSGWVGFGLVCLTLAPIPFIQTLSWTILPLAYLSWIGLGALLIGGFLAIRNRTTLGLGQYIERGIPVVVRVRDLLFAPTAIVNGQAAGFGYKALLDVLDPTTGEPTQVVAESLPIPAARKTSTAISYRVGDYATGVLLPGEPIEKVKLYGFLGLHPELGLIRRDAERPGRWDWLKLIAMIFVGGGFFGALLWNLYAFGRYQPFDFGVREGIAPFAIGGLIGLTCLVLGVLHNRRQRQTLAERHQRAITSGNVDEIIRTIADIEAMAPTSGIVGRVFGGLFLTAGAVLLGGITSLCIAFSINALLDDSGPQIALVQIDELSTVTWNFVYRQYVVDYSFPDEVESRTLHVDPSEIALLQGPLGVAVVREGALGWDWIETILPFFEEFPQGDGTDAGLGIEPEIETPPAEPGPEVDLEAAPVDGP